MAHIICLALNTGGCRLSACMTGSPLGWGWVGAGSQVESLVTALAAELEKLKSEPLALHSLRPIGQEPSPSLLSAQP